MLFKVIFRSPGGLAVGADRVAGARALRARWHEFRRQTWAERDEVRHFGGCASAPAAASYQL